MQDLASYRKSVKQTDLIGRTLVFLRKENKILLGKKLRGIGTGNVVGISGIVQAGETFEAAAKREATEKIGVQVKDIREICHLVYYHVPRKGGFIEQEVKAYET
jgi:8-oxo-dGTP pyrophosphatase MutT (NUDIX family)